MTQATQSQTFNQSVIEGGVSTCKKIGEYEVLTKTPVVNGTLVRAYNFAAGRQYVDAFLVKPSGKTQFLGTKTFNEDDQADRAKALNFLTNGI